MASASALATLIALSNKASEDAAVRLGAAQRTSADAQQKLDLLTQYRDDYAARCQISLNAGIGTAQLENFQAFMHKLEHAIAGQQKVLDDAHARVAHARTAWMQCEQKKMSFTTLAERAAHTALQRELKRDQKQNDEFAARSRVGKPHPL
jgi:flagellar export protein FliJ